jgi:hypothetical protein
MVQIVGTYSTVMGEDYVDFFVAMGIILFEFLNIEVSFTQNI